MVAILGTRSGWTNGANITRLRNMLCQFGENTKNANFGYILCYICHSNGIVHCSEQRKTYYQCVTRLHISMTFVNRINVPICILIKSSNIKNVDST